jgi:thioredoxin 2
MSESTHVVCPACSAVNRLPADKLAQGPKCGKCGEPVFAGKPVHLTDQNFEKQVGRSDIPVVVDFWAEWCGPCKMMAPQFEQAAAQMEPQVRFAKLDTEEAQATAARFGIRSIPTLALFKNGREVARQAGAMSAADIVRWVQANSAIQE